MFGDKARSTHLVRQMKGPEGQSAHRALCLSVRLLWAFFQLRPRATNRAPLRGHAQDGLRGACTSDKGILKWAAFRTGTSLLPENGLWHIVMSVTYQKQQKAEGLLPEGSYGANAYVLVGQRQEKINVPDGGDHLQTVPGSQRTLTSTSPQALLHLL